jgi:hypothetical protein
MSTLPKIIITSVLLVALAASCTKLTHTPNRSEAASSVANVQAADAAKAANKPLNLTVYYPDSDSNQWKQSKGYIKPHARVFAVLGTDGKPKKYDVKVPEKPDQSYSLVEVVFKNYRAKHWYRVFVLDQCINWEKSKTLESNKGLSLSGLEEVKESDVKAMAKMLLVMKSENPVCLFKSADSAGGTNAK